MLLKTSFKRKIAITLATVLLLSSVPIFAEEAKPALETQSLKGGTYASSTVKVGNSKALKTALPTREKDVTFGILAVKTESFDFTMNIMDETGNFFAAEVLANVIIVVTDKAGKPIQPTGEFKYPVKQDEPFTVSIKLDGYEDSYFTHNGININTEEDLVLKKEFFEFTMDIIDELGTSFTAEALANATIVVTDNAGNPILPTDGFKYLVKKDEPFTVSIKLDEYEDKSFALIRGISEDMKLQVMLLRKVILSLFVKNEDNEAFSVLPGTGIVVRDSEGVEIPFTKEYHAELQYPIERGKEYTISVKIDGYKDVELPTGVIDPDYLAHHSLTIVLEKEVEFFEFTMDIIDELGTRFTAEALANATIVVTDNAGNPILPTDGFKYLVKKDEPFTVSVKLDGYEDRDFFIARGITEDTKLQVMLIEKQAEEVEMFELTLDIIDELGTRFTAEALANATIVVTDNAGNPILPTDGFKYLVKKDEPFTVSVKLDGYEDRDFFIARGITEDTKLQVMLIEKQAEEVEMFELTLDIIDELGAPFTAEALANATIVVTDNAGNPILPTDGFKYLVKKDEPFTVSVKLDGYEDRDFFIARGITEDTKLQVMLIEKQAEEVEMFEFTMDIIDELGAPLLGATIVVTDNAGNPILPTDGFKYLVKKDEPFTVSIKLNGYEDKSFAITGISENTNRPVVLTKKPVLPEELTLKLDIKDEWGNPLSGATIVVKDKYGNLITPSSDRLKYIVEKGNRYTVTVKLEGYEDFSLTSRVIEGDLILPIILVKKPLLTLNIFDSNTKIPLSGTTIVVTDKFGNEVKASANNLKYYVAKNGIYTVSVKVDGYYYIKTTTKTITEDTLLNIPMQQLPGGALDKEFPKITPGGDKDDDKVTEDKDDNKVTEDKDDNKVTEDKDTGAIGKFIDIPEKFDWAKAAIYRLVDLGLITGVTEQTYEPESVFTRAQFAVIVTKLYNLKLVDENKISYTDVKPGEWYYDYITIATSNGFFVGYEDGEFKPNKPISRQEIAYVISLFVEKYNYNLPVVSSKTLTDVDTIHNYAKPAVELLTNTGVINGYEDGSFRPLNYVTRAEAAVLIDRFLTVAKVKIK